MSAHVVSLTAVAQEPRAYDRFCRLRQAAAMAFADWIAGPDAPSERDIQMEVFGTCSVFIQTVEMVRPNPAPEWPQGEDWGDVRDDMAGGCDA